MPSYSVFGLLDRWRGIDCCKTKLEMTGKLRAVVVFDNSHSQCSDSFVIGFTLARSRHTRLITFSVI